MLRLRGDVAEPEQIALLQCRVKALGGVAVVVTMRPGFHRAHRAGGAVAVVDLQTEVFVRKVGLHELERFGRLAAQDAFGSAIAGERVAGEIVGRRIAHVLRDAGVDVAQVDEAGRQHVAGVSGQGEEEGEEGVEEGTDHVRPTMS